MANTINAYKKLKSAFLSSWTQLISPSVAKENNGSMPSSGAYSKTAVPMQKARKATPQGGGEQ